jgi:hypothetical protein
LLSNGPHVFAAVGKENVHDWSQDECFHTDGRRPGPVRRDDDSGICASASRTGIKVAMAMPMHAGSKMVRHGKRHMSHHMAAKDNDRYGMK